MKYAAILFTIVVLGVLAGALVLVANHGDDNDEARATNPPYGATASPVASACGENPHPATSDTNRVDAPVAGASVTSPVTVSGRIAAFEATFRITIFDRRGAQIAEQQGMSAEGQTLSAFSQDIAFSISEDTDACIWVYEISARDSKPTNIVQIPVSLKTSGQASACLANPDPATADITRVDAPLADAAVTSPITVSGAIAAFEAQFRITIFNSSGIVIADQTAKSAEGQVLSPFAASVPFSVSRATPACIWVYENSARDGSPAHVVQVPVTLKP
jgi:hypothetical protein